jgi:hypothetical protein
MLETTIIRPLPAETFEEDRRKLYRAVYERIRIAVQRLDRQQRMSKERPITSCQTVTFNEFLSELELTWPEDLLGLRVSVQKAVILYERDVNAIRRIRTILIY